MENLIKILNSSTKICKRRSRCKPKVTSNQSSFFLGTPKEAFKIMRGYYSKVTICAENRNNACPETNCNYSSNNFNKREITDHINNRHIHHAYLKCNYCDKKFYDKTRARYHCHREHKSFLNKKPMFVFDSDIDENESESESEYEHESLSDGENDNKTPEIEEREKEKEKKKEQEQEEDEDEDEDEDEEGEDEKEEEEEEKINQKQKRSNTKTNETRQKGVKKLKSKKTNNIVLVNESNRFKGTPEEAYKEMLKYFETKCIVGKRETKCRDSGCNTFFKNKRNLINHMNAIHIHYRAFGCLHCTERFYSKKTADLHMKRCELKSMEIN